MDKFNKIVDENEILLLQFYNDSLGKIKAQLLNAAEKGNNTTYLKTVKKNVENELTRLAKKFQLYSTEQTTKNYKQGVKGQENNFSKLKIPYEKVTAKYFNQFGGLHKKAIETLAINTYKPLKRVVDVIGRDCIDYFERTNFNDTQSILKALNKFIPDSEDLRKVGLDSVSGTVTGNTTWQKSIRDFRKEFAKDDIFKVPYYKKDGTLSRLVEIKDYAELVARTTSAEAYREGATNAILETFDDMGDLVQVNGKTQYLNSPCIPFENAILSLTGKTKGYTTIDAARMEGLFHPNCVHHFGVTAAVIEEYELIEQGKGHGTVLNDEVVAPPTPQRKVREPKENWDIKDVLETYTGNDKLVKSTFKNAVIDAEAEEILKNIGKLPTVKIIDDKGKGYFQQLRSVISANNERTFLHEFGHSLDCGIVKAAGSYGHFSKKILKSIETNRIKRMDKFPQGVIDKFVEIKKNTFQNSKIDFKARRNWYAVSDIYDALCNGNLYKQPYSIAGHGSKYFRIAGNKELEVFANYFQLRLSGSTEQLDFLKENLPDLLKTLETSFTLYVKEIKNL